MERKASSISSDEAKWVRREFSYAFNDESVSEESRKEVIRVVRELEAQGMSFRVAIMGYLKGAKVLLHRNDWQTFSSWQEQIDFLGTQPKAKKEFQ